jgi:hypothetical protein
MPDLEQLKKLVKYIKRNENMIEPSFVSGMMN